MKAGTLKIYLAILLLACSIAASATHVRAADLKVEPICSAGNFTFRITIVAYLNTSSMTQFGTSSVLSFGDGTSEVLPRRLSTSRPDLGENIGVVIYETNHTYPGSGTYNVGYMERDRNANILNIENSTDVPYVTSIDFTISAQHPCNNLPVLPVAP